MKVNSVIQKIVYGCLFAGLSLQACQKEDDLFVDTKADSGPEPGGTRTEQTLDSIFLYAKEIYLWHDALPSYKDFNPRKYKNFGNGIEGLEREVFDISQLKINEETGNPFEFVSASASYPKYSYLEEDDTFSGLGQSSIKMASNGTENDFGFGLASVSANDIRVRYVYPGSPAGNVNLSRADRLLKVNGREVRADSRSDIDYINSAMNEGSISITVEKQNGAVVTHNLMQTSYAVKPVFKTKVLSTATGKAGYLVFDTFTRLSATQAALDEAFSQFASAGVTDLVIDFRYNGGGYVHTAEYLCELIAPKSLEGSVIYTELYNDLMRSGKADILKNQILLDENNEPQKHMGRNATYADLDFTEAGNTNYFEKKGSLNNINSVVFIVTGNTASASELVINSLKPYMKVAIVGDKSYGKPVGFFGITIDKYKVYMPNFKTINSEGEGDYFDGFEPDVKANDDVRYDFGDPQEESLAMALAIIENGGSIPNGRMASENARTASGTDIEVQNIGDDNKFKGMVEERLKLLK